MFRLKASRRAVPALCLLIASSAIPTAVRAAGPATSRKAQMAFGVQMAQRGLWSEALFRFEAARRLQPHDAAVLNNLAICYEAAGRFEEALTTYREAIEIEPGNRALKANYSRFAEFYQDFRLAPARDEPKAADTAEPAAPPPAPVEPAEPPPASPPVGGAR